VSGAVAGWAAVALLLAATAGWLAVAGHPPSLAAGAILAGWTALFGLLAVGAGHSPANAARTSSASSR
jgi:hypothetical protein